MTVTFDVSGADPGTTSAGATGGPGTLSYAIAQVNASDPAGGPYVINVTGDVTLSGPLSPILGSVTIEGNGHTIDAGGATRIFFVGTDLATMTSSQGDPPSTTSIISQRQQVAINDVTLMGGTAHGGSGSGGGGGGLGAGGALFVNQSADVTLSNVSFSGDSAVGGNGTTTRGTTPFTPQGGGGGGGLGGSGGYLGGGGIFGSGGRYGGGGVFGNGGQSAGGGFSGSAGTTYGYGPQGGSVSYGGNGALPIHGLSGSGGGYGPYSGGSVGGGGTSYAAANSGGGGGFGGGSVTGSNPSAGGFGGGGGSSYGRGGVGGFGGGGGGGFNSAGAGGFGGGGSGTRTDTGGAGGFGGGGGGGFYNQYTSNTNVIGGAGGFGGGGGGSDGTLGTFGGASGFGASASTSTQGGGGAGMGGAVFVASGGTLQISGTSNEMGSTAAGGTGGDGTQASAFGAGIFFQGGAGGTPQTLTFGAGDQTYASQITDLDGAAGNTTTGNGLGGAGGILALAKTGGGTLTLSGANTYTGGTTITGGTVVDGAAGGLGTQAVSFQAASGAATNLVVSAAADPGNVGTFVNTLDSFGLGDTLDLTQLAYQDGATAMVGEGVLTVLSGGLTRRFNVTNPSLGAYGAASDGNGGTLVGAVTNGLVSYTPGAAYDPAAETDVPLVVYNDPSVSYTVTTGTAANGDETVTVSNGVVQQVTDLGSALVALSLNFSQSTAAVSLTGGGGNDRIVGGSGNDTLTGGAGDDTLSGRGGTNVIDGGAGSNDTVSYATFAGTGGVTASLASGTASGAGFSDMLRNLENIRGSIYADTITGNARANILDGYGGADTISGGAGNDRLYITQTPTLVDGGADFDVLTVKAGGSATLTDSTFRNIERVVAENGATLDMSGVSQGLLIRSASTPGGGTTITGTGGNARILGGDGQDLLRGGAGNDVIRAGEANQTIEGGTGNDLIYASTGTGTNNPQDTFNMMMSGFGRDTIRGTAAALSNDIFQVAGLGSQLSDLSFAKFGNGAIVTGSGGQPGDGVFFSGLTVDQAKGLNFRFDAPAST